MLLNQSFGGHRFCRLVFILSTVFFASNCSAQEPPAQSQQTVDQSVPAKAPEASTATDETTKESDSQEHTQTPKRTEPSQVEIAAGMPRFIEGQHYKRLEGVPMYEAGGEVSVQEFFSYGCPHCFQMEPVLEQWHASGGHKGLKFERVPAFWNPYFKTLAQAYYTMDVLGLEESLHKKIFEAIHLQRQNLKTQDGVRTLFVAEGGITAEDFDNTFNSFAVQQKMNMADNQFKTYRLTHVPVFVIGGQYVTDVSMAGSRENVTEIIDYLARKIKIDSKG